MNSSYLFLKFWSIAAKDWYRQFISIAPIFYTFHRVFPDIFTIPRLYNMHITYIEFDIEFNSCNFTLFMNKLNSILFSFPYPKKEVSNLCYFVENWQTFRNTQDLLMGIHSYEPSFKMYLKNVWIGTKLGRNFMGNDVVIRSIYPWITLIDEILVWILR